MGKTKNKHKGEEYTAKTRKFGYECLEEYYKIQDTKILPKN